MLQRLLALSLVASVCNYVVVGTTTTTCARGESSCDEEELGFGRAEAALSEDDVPAAVHLMQTQIQTSRKSASNTTKGRKRFALASHASARGSSKLASLLSSSHILGPAFRHKDDPVDDEAAGDAVAAGGAAEASGVTENQAGDLAALMSNLITNIVTIAVCFGFLSFVQSRYPMIYWNNVNIGITSKVMTTLQIGSWSWMKASNTATIDDIVEIAGLDQGMLMEFCDVAMRTLLLFGAPMLLFMGPVNYIFGHNAAGDDRLSYLSMGNVATCEFGTTCTPWLYYFHAVAVWLVVIAVQMNIHKAMADFVPRRYKWLREMPAPRSTTLLVTNITPESLQDVLGETAKGLSDKTLKDFFEKLLPKKVESAYVVRDTMTLPYECGRYKKATMSLEATGRVLDDATKDKWETQQREAGAEIRTLRKSIGDRAKVDGDSVFCANGFVTFKERKDAEIALNLQFSKNAESFQIESPPDPSAIQWNDLTQDPTAQGVRHFLGYAATVGLYFGYLPCVVGISQVATALDLGALQPMWEGIAPSLGLMLMVGFLPTILLLIFRSFFTLKADVWAQQRLQSWYFIFQVVFVLLITAISGSIQEVMAGLLANPLSIFEVMANSLPGATHFYMNFMILQWSAHAMVATRYVTLFKYLTFARIYEEEDARAMSEPEDQDYYGMGSRSARFTINMCIGIIFGTLSPPIPFLTYINFRICRLVYGYLLPFAETKKDDLGGVFYVSQLEHLFVGNIIYIILMSGVLYFRAETGGPAFICASTMILTVFSMKKFHAKFTWEKLPFNQVADGKGKSDGKYEQPELTEPKL